MVNSFWLSFTAFLAAAFSLSVAFFRQAAGVCLPLQHRNEILKQPGEVLLLENLRFYAEEEGKPRGLAEDATDEEKAAAKKAVKESQKEFTKKLASYADCYVNDAFGTAHRAHASTALIAKYFDKDSKPSASAGVRKPAG